MHLKVAKYFLILVICFSALSCSDLNDDPDDKIVARVNRVSLSESEVDNALKTQKHNGSFRKEYIRNWIEKEILYKEAFEKHVDNKELERILEESKKELAIAFYLNKYFEENPVKLNERELLEFYNTKSDLYKLSEEAVVYNIVRFSEESKAILFRNTLLDSDWNRTMNVFRGDSSIISYEAGRFDFYKAVQSMKLVKILKTLNPGEVSIIFEEEPGVYLIMQIVDKYKKNQIPQLEYIRNEVKKDYETLQKKILYNQLIISLYSKYNVEIK